MSKDSGGGQTPVPGTVPLRVFGGDRRTLTSEPSELSGGIEDRARNVKERGSRLEFRSVTVNLALCRRLIIIIVTMFSNCQNISNGTRFVAFE